MKGIGLQALLCARIGGGVEKSGRVCEATMEGIPHPGCFL
jgi:hypothetical protein